MFINCGFGAYDFQFLKKRASAEIRGEVFRPFFWVIFAGDFLVDFFLRPFPWKTGGKSTKKSTAKSTLQGSGLDNFEPEHT